MTAPVRFKQSDIKRAVSGFADAGMPVGRVEIFPDGRIVVFRDSSGSGSSINPWDAELQP